MAQIADTALGWLARLPRLLAALLAVVLLTLTLTGLAEPLPVERDIAAESKPTTAGMQGDHRLYFLITDRVAQGQPYYEAATATQRAENYPLKPFLTVRLPTLAVFTSIIGLPAMSFLLSVSGMFLAGLIYWRIRAERLGFVPALAASVWVLLNAMHLLSQEWALIHESLAGILIGLALIWPTRGRWWVPVALLGIALSIRELVVPVVLLLALRSALERDWRGLGFALALTALFGLALYWHAHMVELLALPSDPISPGWNAMGGWSTYLQFVHQTTILRFWPQWMAAVAIPLAWLGWLGLGGRLGSTMIVMQMGYAVMFMLFARTSNFYWAMLVAPTLLVGLAFAPRALADLLAAMIGHVNQPNSKVDFAAQGAKPGV